MKKFKKLITLLCTAMVCGAFLMSGVYAAEGDNNPPSEPPVDIDNVDELLEYIEDEINNSENEDSGNENNATEDTESENKNDPNHNNPSANTNSNEDKKPNNGMIQFDIPKGSGTVVDRDFAFDYMRDTAFQFITVQSRSGNTFYIIIEHSEETQNVYFLNAVDDWDLLAFTEEFPDDFLEVMAEERRRNQEEYLKALENQGIEYDENGDEIAKSPIMGGIADDEEKSEGETAPPDNMGMIVVGVLLVVGGIAFVIIKKKKSGGVKKMKNAPVYDDEDEDDEEIEDKEDE